MLTNAAINKNKNKKKVLRLIGECKSIYHFKKLKLDKIMTIFFFTPPLLS